MQISLLIDSEMTESVFTHKISPPLSALFFFTSFLLLHYWTLKRNISFWDYKIFNKLVLYTQSFSIKNLRNWNWIQAWMQEMDYNNEASNGIKFR